MYMGSIFGFFAYFAFIVAFPNLARGIAFGILGIVIGYCAEYDWKDYKETKYQNTGMIVGAIIGFFIGFLL